ncbi:MAG: Ig-like domain-containing protein [Acidobacteriota bacterium]|nr:Ig-like domain-containing protein [Acidobacteriota bacterium]
MTVLRWTGIVLAGLIALCATARASAELDSSCLISALNRTAPVEADGTWVLPNVPANLGKVRLRATCIRDGVVSTGQSEFIEVPTDGVIEVAEIRFDVSEPVPERLVLSAPTTSLTTAGQTVQLNATATYPGGSDVDVSTASAGTTYRSSMATVASVDPDGLVTAAASGTVLVSAVNEGALGLLRLSVVLSGDSDGDGLPDDFELANGLDPNNPDDALLDHDQDGFSTLEEYQQGLDPFDSDTDDDQLLDGAEVGTWGTNPLLFDTDGDGLSDGLEVATGSDPLDRLSFNLAAALESITVLPDSFTIIYNTILGEASRQLTVTGQLIDGNQLDITSDFYGTSYTSDDLLVANFGAEPGRVFAGEDGVTTVTATCSGFSAQADVTVESFAPIALSFLALGGTPRAVALDGTHAYAAMGRPGLKIVDVSDPELPFEAARIYVSSPPPFREYRAVSDVAVQDGMAYVAADGLAVIDVTVPAAPVQIAFLLPPDMSAESVAVRGHRVLVGGSGFQGDPGALALIDISDPVTPVLLGMVGLPGQVEDVLFAGQYAIAATGSAGVQVVDLANEAAPEVVGSTHTRSNSRSSAVGLALAGEQVLVADGGRYGLPGEKPGGLRVIDLADPANPALVGSTNNQFGLTAVAWDGTLALAADYFFVNGVPVFRLGETAPLWTGLVDFSGPPSGRDDNGVDLAVGGGLVYLVGNEGSTGSGGLHIGRYLIPFDAEGVPPTVTLTAPAEGTLVPERQWVQVAADASDDIFVQSVTFSLDGQPVREDFAPPYSARIPVPAGVASVTVTAQARDAGGNVSPVASVELGIEPNSAPVATILAPQDGLGVQGGEVISTVVQATDDVEVDRVEFYVDGALVGTDDRGPSYQTFLNLGSAPGTYQLTALAYDDVGPSAPAGPVSLVVVPDDPPQAQVLEPAEGAEVIAFSLIDVLAGASDAVGIDRVDFYQDGALVGSDFSGPDYRATLATPGPGAVLELWVVAYDTAGQETMSTVNEVTVVADPLTAVTGVVVGLADEPFASATVSARTNEGTTVSGMSDSSGEFLVEQVPAAQGDLSVSVVALQDGEELRASLPEPVSPAAGGVVDVGVLALYYAVPGTLLRGVVEDDAGNPVPDAQVAVHDRFQRQETITDSSGEFVFSRFPVYPGTRFYLSAEATLSSVLYRGKLPNVIPNPIGDTDAGVLTLAPEAGGDPLTTAMGTVLDEEGAPLPDFEVVVTSDSVLVVTMTDASGQYTVPDLPALDGGLVAAASGVVDGQSYREATEDPAAPVPGGTTVLDTLYPFGEDGGGDG